MPEQASVTGAAGSAAVMVITFAALLACTSLLSGSCVAGSGSTLALIAAATLAARTGASGASGWAVYGTGTELTVVISVSPGLNGPVMVAVWAAGTGGAAW